MAQLVRLKVLPLEGAAAGLATVKSRRQGLPRVDQSHACTAERPQLGTRARSSTSLLLGLELALGGAHRLDDAPQRVDGDVVGVGDPLLNGELVDRDRVVVCHGSPSEGLTSETPRRPVSADRRDLTTAPLEATPQPDPEFGAPGRREGTPMLWPSRPRIERARNDASITVLPGAAPPWEEGYQMVALRELLHRSRQHALDGQSWAALTQRPDLENACERAAYAIAEAIDILGGPDHG
jgi:hypothetical protein